MNPMAMKFTGVRIPENQARNAAQRVDAPMGTVVQLIEIKVCGVGIVDEEGRIISTVAYKVGNEWRTDPNGEIWARSLLKAGPKLSANLEEALKQSEALKQEVRVEAKKVNTTAARIYAKMDKASDKVDERNASALDVALEASGSEK